ncbi:hypothetical protein XAC2852_590072 [Xanthomonas citri pv. citri]|nr:hypothetical protein XAC2852_590072 [Xanthomonas citri pv. citri]
MPRKGTPARGTVHRRDWPCRTLPASRRAGTCRERASLVRAGLALQDGAELVGEGLIAHRQPFHAGGKAVVGPHGRNRHEQTDGGGEQRFGDTRRHGRDTGLLAAADHVVHGHHDAEHGTDQADVRRSGADVGQQFEIAFELIDFTGERGAHGALCAFQLHARIQTAAVAQTRELAKAAFEHRLQTADGPVAVGCRGVQLGQIRTGPEAVFELVRLAVGLLERTRLAENDHPADERADQQQQHDDLDRDTGAQDQVYIVDAAVVRHAGGLRRGSGDVLRQCFHYRVLQGQEQCNRHPFVPQ